MDSKKRKSCLCHSVTPALIPLSCSVKRSLKASNKTTAMQVQQASSICMHSTQPAMRDMDR